MAYHVRTESFEGPFDLLLYLVSRQKVDIGTVSVAEIADQYLAEVSRMQSLDLDVASDFLLVASTLLEIKAHSLLPHETSELENELAELEPSEARDLLIGRLVEYKQFKSAAASLEARLDLESHYHGRPFGPDEEYLQVMPDFLRGITLDDLAMTAVAALARREMFLLESEHIAAKPIPVERYVRSLYERVRNEKTVQFSALCGSKKPQLVVVNLLAVLELYKRSIVKISQKKAFGDIRIDYIEGSGDLQLTGADALTSVNEAVL